jgi:hypothetical protein
MLWVIAGVFGLLLIWFLIYLGAIACKSWFPSDVATVQTVSLTQAQGPKTRQVFMTVRYLSGDKEGSLRLLFCRSDKRAVERSRRYQRLVEFYAPGRSFRLFKVPLVGASDPLPECPVVRVETLLVVLAAWCCACVAGGALVALFGE